MMFINLSMKVVADAVILALGIAAAHFIIVGTAIGQSNFLAMLPLCFIFAILNLVIRMAEIHKALKNRE
jgi:hypothetical protein